MDDMGWADIGCYGSEIATPNIDALAGRGIPLHPLYDAPDLLAGARCLIDREKRSFGGDRVASQQQSRLSWLFWGHPARHADYRRDPADGRLCDERGRQMAQFDRRRLA
jgi:hypothetical protein